MQNLLYMSNGEVPPVLNPESVSHYDGLHDAGRCRAADTPQKTTNRGICLELWAEAPYEVYHCTLLCSLFFFAPGSAQGSFLHDPGFPVLF
jgi:hypothetical protein